MLNKLKPDKKFFLDGTVIIAGSGPGNLNKITLQTYQALKMADIIIYDGLVNKNLLKLKSRNAKTIFAGKTFGNKSCTQEEIIEWMIDYAQKKKKVLRLKSGDPSVFGRGSEEIQGLKHSKIPFKVFSGITAAQEAMNELQIEYFGSSGSFVLVTGHKKISEIAPKVDFTKFGNYEGKIIIYMGLNQIKTISKKLIQSGKDKQNRVFIVSKISMDSQKIFKTTLGECIKTDNHFGLSSPSIIIVD